MSERDLTFKYYADHADSFTQNTIDVEFSAMQEHFTKYIKPGGHILDLGCGSGRDSKAFLERGFHVTAVDGSPEICRIASEYIGQPVICATFQKYEPVGKFDGIWACASLLHLRYAEIAPVLRKFTTNLEEEGCFYLSFKYGTFEGVRNGRYFTDMTEERFETILKDVAPMKLIEQFTTIDVRPGREEKWWNGLVGLD